MNVIQRNPFFCILKIASSPIVNIRPESLATYPKTSPPQSSQYQGIIFCTITNSILCIGTVIKATNSAKNLDGYSIFVSL